MTADAIVARLRSTLDDPPPLPGKGQTAERHRRLFELGREDLSLARIAEAHWDAVAILAEAGHLPAPHAIYAVWASEIPGKYLQTDSHHTAIFGTKMFCSGAGLVDRALVTAGSPEPELLDVDLARNRERITIDSSTWITSAFAETKTAAVTFNAVSFAPGDRVCDAGWYLRRPGFWHGACGPAACWAGGAAGLVDWALKQGRRDSHTLAHLGAMQSAVWAMAALLGRTGDEIDEAPTDERSAHIRALMLRHLIEQAASDILRRIVRAFGPHPLALDASISQRYQELDLYLRQSHAERDLEALGAVLVQQP